jgi:hypothetical protein
MSTEMPHTIPQARRDEPATRHLRLQVELVVEVTDREALTAAALEQAEDDDLLPDGERDRARAAVQRDESEALALLVDPFDLVNGLPGVELRQASWNSEHTEYDPDDDEWEFEEETDATP